ncbi:hypothetical protein UFOVP1028_13 [uncultured Caudovirales phage]|uniref:Uncharacterized protein n=1 Tax=uncultured Caudovirales phage TaxID=2100421 RepID=A0A6J5QBT7_9CAUD|nr:hypothetical protein UFOVP960_24 [uncultured Caudovirales phage]CAB4178878.1 hypothetical protein UFOVP1028_13 [uncultured Caudovirales phage]CAB4189405.1 hypothetical protein UFOVP1187_6 [uncultured Caudovirales phage]CAB4192282.1 hypothetical protein UFOVP1235_23 [uncultured Caudovirales phage]CAB4215774.1 hypothetical protein UFOVP1488_6 [uncultured Caudovirales phage]
MMVETFVDAQAVSICWLAGKRGWGGASEMWRALQLMADRYHDEGSCGWCQYPQDVKMAAVEAWNRRPDADQQRVRFFALGSLTKRRAIRVAQGYEVAPS